MAIVFGVTLAAGLYALSRRDAQPRTPSEAALTAAILAAHRAAQPSATLRILYPLDETVFPPEIVAPTFRWQDGQAEADAWLVLVQFQDGKGQLTALASETQWRPPSEQWEAIKRRSLGTEATVSVMGVNRAAPTKALSAARIRISTSKDEVGAPLFYREVNLPFLDAVKDPSKIRWRFGHIGSEQQPPIVLQGLPVCGNCHSFAANGRTLGMDVDYANDKGAYAITPVSEEMVLDKSKIITWSDYKRGDGELTFGLLSQVSPSGQYVVSTVKDRSVSVPTPGLEFSQLFFPVKGIIGVYCRQTSAFSVLPGADDKEFVQSNPTWSPDGEHVVFARSRALTLPNVTHSNVLLNPEECPEFIQGKRTFLFDLYRVPFNEGKGGKAEPIEGASHNGMSNYFPKYSPDGKWIVFCKAKSFMLLQPDSELYIVPAAGGVARRMRCNTPRMNSWHSWSPNGKWLVFSSKANGPCTQLFLAHVDAEGESTPPVRLEHFVSPDRAANIPEFVNLSPDAIRAIREQFVEARHFARAGDLRSRLRDNDGAMAAYREALRLSPTDARLHTVLALHLAKRGELKEAEDHAAKAIECGPNDVRSRLTMGHVLLLQGRAEDAITRFREALRMDPQHNWTRLNLGVALSTAGQLAEAADQLSEAIRVNPRSVAAHFELGRVLVKQGKADAAIVEYRRALDLDPKLVKALLSLAAMRATASDPTLRNGPEAVELALRACQLGQDRMKALDVLGAAYAEARQFPEAILAAQKAIQLAEDAGDHESARAIRARIELYQRAQPIPADGFLDPVRREDLGGHE